VITWEQIGRSFLSNLMNQVPFDNPGFSLYIPAKSSKTFKDGGTSGFQQGIGVLTRQTDPNEPAGDLGNAPAFAASYTGQLPVLLRFEQDLCPVHSFHDLSIYTYTPRCQVEYREASLLAAGGPVGPEDQPLAAPSTYSRDWWRK
jgi:hypothetical protein